MGVSEEPILYGQAPPLSYEENYDIIAQTHLESLRGGNGNPWMDADDIAHFAKETVALVERFTDDGEKVLDAGCGPGELELYLDSERFKVTGLDLSADYLGYAKERTPDVRYVQGNIEQLPFEDESFDTAVACDVLEHVLHLDDTIREMLRVLRRGGHLILRVPVEEAIGQYLYANPYYYVHLRRFDKADLVLMFTRSWGCEVILIRPCPRVQGAEPHELHCVVRKP